MFRFKKLILKAVTALYVLVMFCGAYTFNSFARSQPHTIVYMPGSVISPTNWNAKKYSRTGRTYNQWINGYYVSSVSQWTVNCGATWTAVCDNFLLYNTQNYPVSSYYWKAPGASLVLKHNYSVANLVFHYSSNNDDNEWNACDQITINPTWSGWSRGANPTCTAAGYNQRTCSGCGAVEKTSIVALGHSWTTGWEHNGNQHYKRCTRCGALASQANHTFGGYYNSTATCTAAGTRQRKCSTCGYVETSTAQSFGHAWPSSCSQSGGYLYKNCTRCGARLETKGISYTIAYDGNGATSGTMTNQGFIYGTAQNLKQNAFIRQDYDFLGWSTTANASPSYKDQQSVNNLTTTNNATITMYAIWKLSTTTITFHDNGGSGGPGNVTWLIGSTQRPTPPIRAGHNFVGWNTAEDGSGIDWPKNNIVQAGQPDYYAQWIPNMYTAIEEQNY